MKRKKAIEGAGGFLGGVIKQSGEFIKSRDAGKMKAAIRPAATFILSLLFSMVRAPMGIYPFSFAVLAASSGGLMTAAAFAGSLAGAGTMGVGAIKQMLILISMGAVRVAVCFFKGDFKEKNGLFRRLFRERGYIRVIIASAGAAAAGCVGIIESESLYYGLFSALLGIGEAAVITAAFIFFADKSADRSKRVAGLAVFALGCCSACEFLGLPFSLGAVLAFFAAVYFSCFGTSSLGAVIGFCGGIAVGAQYGAAFGIAGIVSSFVWEYSRVGAVVISAVASSVLSLFCGGVDAFSEIIPEITFAAALSAPLMSSGALSGGIPAFLNVDGENVVESGDTRVKSRYEKIGKAMDSLSEMIREVSDKMRLPTRQEAYRIATTVRAKHCSGCVHEKDCSGADCQTVDSMFSNMEYRLTTNGRISAKIVPESVARRCFKIDSIIESMNLSSRRASGLSGTARKAQMFASDYSAIADLMQCIAADDEYERDEDGEKRLAAELSEEGFSFSQASVYGKRARRVYMRGVDPAASGTGERDIRLCSERVLGARLSSPEFSIDGHQISASMHSVPVIKLSLGKFALSSRRDNASGDSICSFENDEGYHYTIVSDGMGSGREAAVTSSISAAFLQKLLQSGCPMRSALELLNCFVRGSDGECFTTVDLMEVDLYTGRARFIKSGAAPSFVLRKGQLYRLHSKTVPVGIMRALDAESLSFDLSVGDTVIMVSDGVTGSYEESPWLYDLLSEEGLSDIESPGGMARYIAQAAEKNTGRDDDITVCVIKIERA